MAGSGISRTTAGTSIRSSEPHPNSGIDGTCMPHSDYRILVVDDEPMIREILRETLEQEGHRVAEAENGKVACDRVNSEQFDLILTDVKMPVMDGFTLMKNLGDLTDEIPVIVITSFSDIDVAVDSIRLGAY